MHVYVCLYVMCVCICVCVYMYMVVCVCVHIFIYIYKAFWELKNMSVNEYMCCTFLFQDLYLCEKC